MVPQHEARSQESIGSRFEMTCDAANEMKLPPIDARMPGGIREEALLGGAEMVEELGAHLVADERYRLPLEQAAGRRLQHIAQVILRHLGTDHFMKRLAVTQGCLYCLLKGTSSLSRLRALFQSMRNTKRDPRHSKKLASPASSRASNRPRVT